jgi:hypothetical protein
MMDVTAIAVCLSLVLDLGFNTVRLLFGMHSLNQLPGCIIQRSVSPPKRGQKQQQQQPGPFKTSLTRLRSQLVEPLIAEMGIAITVTM